jgi:hypothetical protein
MLVVRMLQTMVLLVGHRMGQMNPIAILLEQIRQPRFCASHFLLYPE